MKILVLTKARYNYGKDQYGEAGYGVPIGLSNSAEFITDALSEISYQISHQALTDGNSIDKAVSEDHCTHVILEALWVTPTKLAELAKLHPTIQWIVRLHSNIPFLAMEGNAFGWSRQLLTIPRVAVVANNAQTAQELTDAFRQYVGFLPNIYLKPRYCPGQGIYRHQNELHISCFGAVRPFKNHLVQAVAAMEAAEQLHRTLVFHINGDRVEQRGDSVVQNMIALFADTQHQLIFHDWQPHPEFLLTVARMDLGLQVSFTESFNIVAADHVHVGVPIVVSAELDWLPIYSYAKATSVADIVNRIHRQLQLGDVAVRANRGALDTYNQQGYKAWVEYLEVK